MKYNDVVVGEAIEFRKFRVTPEMQLAYLEVLEDENPLYTGGEAPVAHPVVVMNYAFPSEWISRFAVHVHTKNQVKFLATTTVGKEITVRTRVHDKYTRRGRVYVTTEFNCVDEDGVELLRCRWTETHGTVEEHQ